MRILHLGKFFPPHAGGIERFSADLTAAIARHQVPQSMLVHASPGERRTSPQWIEADSILMRETPCRGRLMFTPVSPAWPLHCRQLIHSFKPDLLHIHAPNPSAFWLFGLPSARKLPWVVQWHADVPDDAAHKGVRIAYPAYRQLERRLLTRAHTVVPTTRRYLEASSALQQHRDRCEVIPLAIADASDAAAACRWPGSGMRLLAVGRLSYYKGFDVLIDAMSRSTSASLVIIGEGEQRPILEQRIGQHDLQSRVELRGQVDDADLHAAFRDCDALCLPSLDRSEAFGLVLLEAMRAGKPTLISAVPGSGMTEVVADRCTGLHVPPGDAAALAVAIDELAGDKDLRSRLGAAGRERWRDNYCIDTVSRRWIDLYRRVLDQPAVRPAQDDA